MRRCICYTDLEQVAGGKVNVRDIYFTHMNMIRTVQYSKLNREYTRTTHYPQRNNTRQKHFLHLGLP